jgi:hypothetical protein
MATTNIIVQWSDVNYDSITKYKYSYSKDGGVNWITTSSKDIIPTKISPLTLPFDTNELNLKSGEYLIKVSLYDGNLWSNESDSVSLRVSSYVDNITKESNINDKSVTTTFMVRSKSDLQTIKVQPITNSSTGFKAELYKGLTKLSELNWESLVMESKNFIFTPTSNDEEYKIKITANIPLGADYNDIIATLSLLKDTNNTNFTTVNVSRNNPEYNNLAQNYLYLEKVDNINYLKSQYPIESDLYVELTNIVTSDTVTIYMPQGSNSIEIDYDIDVYIISGIEPEEDLIYTYHFT